MVMNELFQVMVLQHIQSYTTLIESIEKTVTSDMSKTKVKDAYFLFRHTEVVCARSTKKRSHQIDQFPLHQK